MELGLDGKVAMVAASSKGIGRAIAEMLAREGCRVSGCARNISGVQPAGVNYYAADVSNAESLREWYDATCRDLGPPSILVTNTGGPPAGNFRTLSDEQWQAGFDSTLMNVVRMVRLASPSMIESGWGRVVHLTSFVAKEPATLLPISSTLRAGLMALTRLQATEFGPHGITVNAVLPGHTMTDRQVHLAEIIADRDGISVEVALARQAKTNPMERIGTAEEIAAGVVFLCSKPAAFITGTNLLADGGLVKGIG